MLKHILFVAAMSIPIFPALSQDDSTRYINGLPVTEDDTVAQFPPTDLSPKTNLLPVPADALPPALVRTLNQEKQYRGWNDTTVYFNSNTKLYLVHVKTDEGVKIFGLNERGRPVTFDQVDRTPK